MIQPMIIKIAMCVVGWMFAIAKLSLPEAHVTISGRSNSSILKQKEHTANFQPFDLAQYCSFESNTSSKKAFVLLFLYSLNHPHIQITGCISCCKCCITFTNQITIPHCLKLKKGFAIFWQCCVQLCLIM